MHTAARPVAHHARAQLPLVPEPQLPLLEFAVWGELMRPAELRVAVDKSVHVIVRLRQKNDRLPFVAMRHAPEAEAAFMRDLVARLPAGTPVVVRFRGLEVAQHDGDYVLRAVICDDLARANFIPTHPEQPS